MNDTVTPQEMRWFVSGGAEQVSSSMPAGSHSTAPYAPASHDRAATWARIADEIERPGSAGDRFLDALQALAEHAWLVRWAALVDAEGLPASTDLTLAAEADRARVVRAWLTAGPNDSHALADLLRVIHDCLAELTSESWSLQPRSIVEQLRRRLFGAEPLPPAAWRSFYTAAARGMEYLPGGTLQDRLAREPIAPARSRRVGRADCRGGSLCASVRHRSSRSQARQYFARRRGASESR